MFIFIRSYGRRTAIFYFFFQIASIVSRIWNLHLSYYVRPNKQNFRSTCQIDLIFYEDVANWMKLRYWKRLFRTIYWFWDFHKYVVGGHKPLPSKRSWVIMISIFDMWARPNLLWRNCFWDFQKNCGWGSYAPHRELGKHAWFPIHNSECCWAIENARSAKYTVFETFKECGRVSHAPK